MTDTTKSFRFDWRRRLRRDPRISDKHKIVILELEDYADADGTNAHPGVRRLAEELLTKKGATGLNTVRRALVVACEIGYLELTKKGSAGRGGRGHADVYRIVFPADTDVKGSMMAEPFTDDVSTTERVPLSALKGSASDLKGSAIADTHQTNTPAKEHQTTTVVAENSDARAERVRTVAPTPSGAALDFMQSIRDTDDEPTPARRTGLLDDLLDGFMASVPETAPEPRRAIAPAPADEVIDAEVVEEFMLDVPVAENEKRIEENQPAKNIAPEQTATANAYERTGKAFNFIATKKIAQWAIHDRLATPADVEECFVSIYKAGRPITKTNVGQWLDGITGPRANGGRSKHDAKILGYLETGERLKAQLREQRGDGPEQPALDEPLF